MSDSSSEGSPEPTRAGLGASRPALGASSSSYRPPPLPSFPAHSSSDYSEHSSVSSDPDVDASGLPSTFGGSKSRKRRRISRPPPSLPPKLKQDQPPGHWERHTRGIASKILAKHGFSGRLGANADGIAAPVQPVLRPAGLGLGAGDFQEKPIADDVKEQVKERDARTEKAVEKEKKWKKKDHSSQKRPRSRGHIEMPAVLDMRGQVPRQLPSVAAALAEDGRMKVPQNGQTTACDPLFAVPEIAYNLRMLTDTARVQLGEAKRRRATEKLIKDTAAAEHVKVRRELADAKKAVVELEKLEDLLRQLARTADDATDIHFEAALTEFSSFAKGIVKAGYLAASCVTDALAEVVHKRADRRLAECLSSTSKQTRKSRHRQARHICAMLVIAREALSEESYITLCTLLVLQRVRRVVARADWDAVEGAWVADVVGEMREALPDAVVAAFAEDVLVPRLVARLDQWKEKDASLHMWIHPWLPVVGRRGLAEVLGRVRVLLTRGLERWSVEDGTEKMKEVVGVLRTWTGVLSRRKVQLALARHVTPKLVVGVERFCSSGAEVGKYSKGGCGVPRCFEDLELWAEVISSRLMGAAVVGPMFIGLCRWMRGYVFAVSEVEGIEQRLMRWERGCEYYARWKGWIPPRIVGAVRSGLGAVLFILHAGRVEERVEVRSKLAGAEVKGLLRNRFAVREAEKEVKGGREEAIERWRAERMGLKDTVLHVAKREGLAVVGGTRLSNGLGVLQVGRVRVAVDGRRGVLLLVEGEDGGKEMMTVVGVQEMVRLAKPLI